VRVWSGRERLVSAVIEARRRERANVVRCARWTEEGCGVLIERDALGMWTVDEVDRVDLRRIEARQ
jgi:hypothetical protein